MSSKGKKKSTSGSGAINEGSVQGVEGNAEIYETKLKDLTERLARMKQKCDSLGRENEELVKAQISNTQDKRDIVEFLNLKLQEQSDQLLRLDGKINSLETEKKELVEKYESELREKESSYKNEMEVKVSELTRCYSELGQLSEFKTKKDEFSDQIKELRLVLDQKDQEYKNSIHAIEKKVLQDKTQLKKEMLQKVHDAVSSFRKVADQQMAETTKRAIVENTALTNQLQKMSEKTMEVINENKELQNQLATLKAENSLLRHAEKSFAKRNVSHQKVIQMLVEKLQQTDKMLEIAYDTGIMDEANDKALNELFNFEASPQIQEELKALKDFSNELSEQNDALKEIVEEIAEQLKKVKGKTTRLLDEATWKQIESSVKRYADLENTEISINQEVADSQMSMTRSRSITGRHASFTEHEEHTDQRKKMSEPLIQGMQKRRGISEKKATASLT